ncbi:Sugar efflux transporter for intercellular exchange [Nesidiocoris tenuis]|uniref:Sugar transporter SWEET n=1 Tax=Nesidiocoris tenuis TaxID=355587 RepID=A0ABN7ABB0_9HEMI|nr:Sugar efflux transporter for intercellular exchange [Nesidiocoris tenuis]
MWTLIEPDLKLPLWHQKTSSSASPPRYCIMALKDYQNLLGRLAGSLGVCHLIIPGMICLQIIRQGNTENISPLHFIIGGCITIMKMRHGQLLNSSHMITSTAVGFSLCCIYISIFTLYTDNRKRVLTLIGRSAVVPALLIGYTFMDDESRAEKVYGSACTALMFCLMSFPLFKIKEIVRQKHTGDLSLAMALFGAVHSSLWFLYSLTLGNYIEIFSRFLGVAMLAPQLVLFCLYPMPKSTSQKVKKSE